MAAKDGRFLENVNATMSMEGIPLTQEESELAINCFECKIDFGEAIANLVKMYAPKSMVR